ncbi:MAG TPA: NrfD/PsrC family molybdoenzyme membrane anchor subunit [bacterium]|nr:NrfD/PsrC family molybdoenzyme membrane anchor subunit [bacterium]
MIERRRRDEFSPREHVLLASMHAAGRSYYALVGGLLAIIIWGFIAYSVQLRYGLGVTGLRDNFMWGVYITNFVFFIGVSHVGALMSAILRLTGAEWRRPITRMAEAITFASLLMGALMPFVDMGRPDRFLNLLLHGRLQSPILWDIMSIGTYLTGSTLFLYVPMIPDIALLRDYYAHGPTWRRRLYTVLALGWRGAAVQKHYLETIMAVLAVLIIPIAISVHTVVSWIMGMTLRAGWNSTIFGPYFVSGALFSGAAAVVTAMAAFRRAYHLEDYITVRHFKRMGYLVITLGVIYAYFTFAEYWTPTFKMAAHERGYLSAVFSGKFAPLFWFTQIGGLLVPLLLLTLPTISKVARLREISMLQPRPALAAVAATAALFVFVSLSGSPAAALIDGAALRALLPWVAVPVGVWLFVAFLPAFRERPVAAAVVASVLVNIGAWIKRFVIIVPTLQFPFLPIQRAPAGWAFYRPSWVEWSITAAALAGFALIYILFSKLFPIVSMWETREEQAGPAGPEPAPGGVAHAPAP